MNYWWVNQNQTYVHEVRGGYLWSPKTNANGAYNRFYHAMTEVAPGDVVFCFADTYIKAIGVVAGPHQSAGKPSDFGSAGANWSDEGWYVPVSFEELDRPVRPKDHMSQLAPALPDKYSPLQANGNGNQGVYLAPVPPVLASRLLALLGGQVEEILEKGTSAAEADDSGAIDHLLADGDLPRTQRAQLIQARIGQGLFRSRVSEIELRCRVTGIAEPQFLIASHVKPWAKSDNLEKLDGHNGLLLAPHIDRLFDKGYISFECSGVLLTSPKLPGTIREAWGLAAAIAPKPLTERQRGYMTYHRDHIFMP